MDPDLTTGTRKLWTELDAAALTDIGWDVIDLSGLAGDYNGDGRVDAADYTVWRDARDGGGPSVGTYSAWSGNYGASAPSTGLSVPEPTTAWLVLAGLAMGCRLTRR